MRLGTISDYVTKTIQNAIYEYCDETNSWCGYVLELPGCWAMGNTIEEVRSELIEVIEGWIILALQLGDPIPELDGLTIGKVIEDGEYISVSTSETARVQRM